VDRLNDLQIKFDQLLLQLKEEKVLRNQLLQQMATENIKQNERFHGLKTEFWAQTHLLMNQNTRHDEEIRQLMKLRNNDDNFASKCKEKYENNALSIFDNDTDSTKSEDHSILPRTPPSSCRQLSIIGHFLNGIYLVANPDTNKIETVFCDFGSSARKTY